VEWLDGRGKPRVLFAFEPMKWRVPKGEEVVELTSGDRYVAKEGVVRAEPWRVYLVGRVRPPSSRLGSSIGGEEGGI